MFGPPFGVVLLRVPALSQHPSSKLRLHAVLFGHLEYEHSSSFTGEVHIQWYSTFLAKLSKSWWCNHVWVEPIPLKPTCEKPLMRLLAAEVSLRKDSSWLPEAKRTAVSQHGMPNQPLFFSLHHPDVDLLVMQPKACKLIRRYIKIP